jgi:hypothetical protein
MRTTLLASGISIFLHSILVLASNPQFDNRCSIGIDRVPLLDDRHMRCVVFQINDLECGAVIGDGAECYIGIIGKDEDSKAAFVRLNSGLINPRIPIVAASDPTETFAIWNSTKSDSWRSFLFNRSNLSSDVEFKIDQQMDIKSSTSYEGRTIALIQNRWSHSSVGANILFLKNGRPVVSPVDSPPLGAHAITMRANRLAVAVKTPGGAKVNVFANEDLENLSKRKVDDRELVLDYLPEELALLCNDRVSAAHKLDKSKFAIDVFTLGNRKSDASIQISAIGILAYSASLKAEKLAIVVEREAGKYALLTFEIESSKIILESTREFEPHDLESFSDFTIAWVGDRPVIGWRNFSPID